MGEFARPASQLASVGVPLGPLPRPIVASPEWPIGMVGLWLWASTDLPDNFRVCDGTTLPANEFPVLAALAGVATHGTITLPNMKGRFPLGVDSADSTHDTVRETGGEKTHTLTVAEMPSHDHGSGHNAFLVADSGAATFFSGPNVAYTTETTTTIAGSDDPHNNMPPFMAGFWVVRVK